MSNEQVIEALNQCGLDVDPTLISRMRAKDSCSGAFEGLIAAIQNADKTSPLALLEHDALVSLHWDALLSTWGRLQPVPDWLKRLPAFDGEVLTDGTPLDIAAWDYGKVRHRSPAAVLRPAHAKDVAAAVKFCRAEGIGLSPRGFAHSAGGQMQIHGGLIIDMKSMQRVIELEETHCVVEAGAGWDVVLEAATTIGKTPPIVTDWLKVSVGGTLSMGGFGFMSFWRGTQMDHLLELEVVTGEGERVVCSRERNADLFDAVKGTHGKFGIITRAKIPLEPAPERVRLVQACYGNLRAMYRDFDRHTQDQSTDLIHAFAAERSRSSIVTRMNSTEAIAFEEADVDRLLAADSGPWVFNLELVDFIGGPHQGRHGLVDVEALECEPGLVASWEMDWKSFCFRVPPLVLEEQFKGAAPHPELCAWVPMNEEGLALLDAEFSRLHPSEDIGNGPVLFFPLNTAQVGASFFRLPSADHCLFWGILRRADPPEKERIAQLMADNEAVYGRVRSIGGERYLPDTPPDTAAFWRTHFGEQWDALCAARKRWDPDGIFGSSFGNFT